MFAKHPRLAKEWAAETPDLKNLPEKVPMSKKAADDGRFFEKRALPVKGRFFRDMSGRDDGMFMGKTAQTPPPPGAGSPAQQAANAPKTQESTKTDIGVSGAPMGGSGFRGQGMGGGMYGTGDGSGAKIAESKSEYGSPAWERDRSIKIRADMMKRNPTWDVRTPEDPYASTKATWDGQANAYVGGLGPKPTLPKPGTVKPRGAKVQKPSSSGPMQMPKTSSASPSSWDADSGMPTGFHRPAREQPEPLEEGGERFHSTESNSVVPPSNRQRHGVVEGGSMTVRATSSPQMGKHASVSRFMGTSYGIEKSAYDSDPSYYRDAPKKGPDTGSWAGDRASEFKGSIGKAVGGAGSALGEGIKSITTSPAAATIATLIAAKMGLGGAKRLLRGARGTKALAKVAPKAAHSGGFIGKLMGGARDLVSGAKKYVTK